jgi:K+-sensing histidine kinase KdpD
MTEQSLQSVGNVSGKKTLNEKVPMNRNKRILVAVDDSKASMRVVNYVAKLIAGKKDFTVCLLHVLAALPPELTEFRGSEDPVREKELGKELKDKRAQWIERSKTKALPALRKAKSIFKKARLPAQAVDTEFWIDINSKGLAGDILDAAQLNKCSTVVVGRKSFSWLEEIFRHHVADELVRDAHNLTIWVVE